MNQRILNVSPNDGLEREISAIQRILIELFQELHYRLQQRMREPKIRYIAFLTASVLLLKMIVFFINQYRSEKKIRHLKLQNSKLALENALLRKRLSLR